MNDYLLVLTSTWFTEPAQEPARDKGRSNAMVVRMLADEFRVDETLVNALHPRGLAYIEVRRVLSMARQLPGGINSGNIGKVMRMRWGDGQGKTWAEIARELDVALDHRGSGDRVRHLLQ